MQVKNLKFTILAMFVCQLAQGQQLISNIFSAGNIGTGYASGGFSDYRSMGFNPTAIANIKTLQGGITADRRFVTAELQNINAGLAIPLKNSGMGITAQSFGFDLYRESLIQLSYGRKLTKFLSIGAGFQYLNVNIRDYGQKSIPGFQLGLDARVNSNLRLYTTVQNPNRPKFSEEQRLPAILAFGGVYTASNKLSVVGEIVKVLNQKQDFRFGIIYQPYQLLSVRAGAHTYPAEATFGFGLRIMKTLILDTSAAWHNTLGFTPALGLSYGL